MELPSYQEYYPYILKYADDEKTSDEYLELIMASMKISDEDQLQKNISGEPTVRNRLRWGIHYLRHAGLMQKPARGKYVITQRGIEVREEYGFEINNKTLEKFEEFLKFKSKVKSYDKETNKDESESNDETFTPLENLENASLRLRQELKVELNNQIMEMSPYFFEKVVIDLLKEMGYGSFDGTQVTKKSGDRGVDGIVYQDILGLDVIYIQAKRNKEDNKVGAPDLQKFSGALSGFQASKGIFFTTSDFSSEALDYIKSTPQKIILINGDKLLDLMVDFEIGTEITNSYATYKINEDYFSE